MAFDIDIARELAGELGFWPATTDVTDIEQHRKLNKALDAAPDLETVGKKFAHLGRRKSCDDMDSVVVQLDCGEGLP